ncbi:hypothetical protein PAMP_002985 [Pampus punctatissimus]
MPVRALYLSCVHIAFCSRALGGQPTGQQQHRGSFHRHRLFSSSLLRSVRSLEHIAVLQPSGNASAQLPPEKLQFVI